MISYSSAPPYKGLIQVLLNKRTTASEALASAMPSDRYIDIPLEQGTVENTSRVYKYIPPYDGYCFLSDKGYPKWSSSIAQGSARIGWFQSQHTLDAFLLLPVRKGKEVVFNYCGATATACFIKGMGQRDD